MQYVLSVSLFFIAAFLIIISVYAIRVQPLSQVALSLSVFMFALAVYAAGYAGELLSSKLTWMRFWNTVQYLGISFIPFLWITFTALYTNASFIRIKFVRLLLPVLSCITLFGALTDPCLHLKYESVHIGMDPGFPVLAFSKGPIYYFQVIYMLISLISGIVLLVHTLSAAGRSFRKAILLMSVGSILPVIDYILYLMNIRFSGIDTIPFSMFFSVICCGMAIFSEKLLDAVPVARSLVFEMMSDAVIVVSCRNKTADYNKAAGRLFPDIVNGINPIPALCKTDEIPENGEFRKDILCDGEVRTFICHVTDIPAAPGRHELQGRIFLFKDITDTARLLKKMEDLATIDPLTRLYNRRYFMEQAEIIISGLKKTTGSLSFIIADLDLFKQINDTRGHLAGDAAIQAAAAVFIDIIKPPAIAARFGGEEFICLLPDVNAAAAFTIAERIREKIAQIPYPPGNRNKDLVITDKTGTSKKIPYLTASFGVSSVEKAFDEQTITRLVSCADKALYKSKDSGRNCTTIG
ncbi:MAG: diguanylate cyclase [Treponema sp.]|nr:diguanylate cyclase [Treponema sp.]